MNIIMIKRLTIYIVGLFLIGLGVGSVVHSSYGQSPLETLYVTISKNVHISLGEASWLVGISLVICLMLYTKSLKPFASLITVVLLGYMIDLGKSLNDLVAINHVFLFFGGMILIGIGIALYIRPKLSVTPFDTVMVIVKSKVRGKIHIAKLIVDSSAVGIIIILGGIGNIKFGMIFMILTMPFLIKFVENTFDKLGLFVYDLKIPVRKRIFINTRQLSPIKIRKSEHKHMFTRLNPGDRHFFYNDRNSI